MRETVKSYLSLLRAKHWIKNLFLFAAPFFGGRLFDGHTLLTALPAFVAFSLGASAGYILNDIADIEKDRLHPHKRKRPITSGSVPRGTAALCAVALAFASFAVSYMVDPVFSVFVLSYFLIHMVYSFYLKNIPIADIFCIASGFIIRVLSGGVAFHVEVSKWLLLTMFMISLVLAAGKRLGEATLLLGKVEEHRKSLTVHSVSTFNEILLISSSAALIAYALYTVEQMSSLVYTIPIVTFGLFRYLLLSKHGVGDPTDALMKDKWLALTVLLWVSLVGLLRYA